MALAIKSVDLVRVLLKQVESAVPSSSHIAVQDISFTGFSIQVGSSCGAFVTVSICDTSIPSFAATYPALKDEQVDAAGTIEERTSTDMRAEAIVWIVRKVFRYGFVPPEGYRKKQKNRGRPKLPEGSAPGHPKEKRIVWGAVEKPFV